ncbi:hypothetical protein PSYMO_35966, partial [Pseudomonas amygdali pv. mori str. 301020]
ENIRLLQTFPRELQACYGIICFSILFILNFLFMWSAPLDRFHIKQSTRL